jgi:hypothetical protein
MATTIIKGQVVDYHLTGLAQGFAAGGLVSEKFFPVIKTPLRKFDYIVWDKKALRALDSSRGYGAKTVQRSFKWDVAGSVLPPGYSGEFFVDRREVEQERQVPNLSIQTQSLELLVADMKREKELKAATILTNVASYAVGNYGNVSNAGVADGAGNKGWGRSDTDIFSDVQNGIAAIQKSLGVRKGFALGVTFDVFNAMIKNASIQKFGLNTAPWAAAMIDETVLAKILRVDEVVICDGVYTNSADATTNIYGTGFAALIYRAASPAGNKVDPSLLPPSFGWSVQLDKYPYVDSYYDASRTSDIWQNHDCYLHLPTSNIAGYLWQSVLS